MHDVGGQGSGSAPQRMFENPLSPVFGPLTKYRLPLLVAAFVAAALGSPSASASVSSSPSPEPLLAIDSLFSVDNRGLTRLFVTLNTYRFKLVTDPDEAAQSANAFLVPRNGLITIDIADLLAPDDANPFDDDCTAPMPNGNNCIAIVSQGPDDANSQIIISDTPISGQPIAYRITRMDLEELPDALTLKPSYPNPFLDRATITYTIPEERSSGVAVALAIYDLLGRRVRTLVDTRQFPGTFSVDWDGRDGAGDPVAAGAYLCRLTAADSEYSFVLTRLR